MNLIIKTIILYSIVFLAGVLLTFGIFLEKGTAKAITLGIGIGLYNSLMLILYEMARRK